MTTATDIPLFTGKLRWLESCPPISTVWGISSEKRPFSTVPTSSLVLWILLIIMHSAARRWEEERARAILYWITGIFSGSNAILFQIRVIPRIVCASNSSFLDSSASQTLEVFQEPGPCDSEVPFLEWGEKVVKKAIKTYGSSNYSDYHKQDLGEHLRGSREHEWKACDLQMLLPYCKAKNVLERNQYGHVKISVRYRPERKKFR